MEVSKITKTLDRVLRGTSDANIGFNDLCSLLKHLGFAERIRGSHHIFTRDGVVEILNLQPKAGKAKAYQVRQVRAVIVAYALAGEPETPAREEPSSREEPQSEAPEEEHGQ